MRRWTGISLALPKLQPHRWCGVGLTLAALCLPQVRAEAAAELRWAVVDWPPAFLLPKGKAPQTMAELGDGQFDRLFKELAVRMPEFRHRPELVNSTRLWWAMAEGQPFCAGPLRKKPERLEVAYFTPAVRLAPISLVARREAVLALLEPDGRISLATLQAHAPLRGRLEAARSYGATIDALVAGPSGVPREPTSRVGQLTELVSAGREDYTLEYAFAVEYLRRQGRLRGELVTLPLKEAGDWETGYMVCPRTPWGLNAITAMDRAIRHAATSREFRDAYLRWLPAADRQAQQGPTDAFYKARAQGGPQIE